MGEYLAPGVYVEEVSFRAPSIEGVGTTTTAFVGPTRTGPVAGMPYGGLPASGSAAAGTPGGGVPDLLTSYGDFEAIYGSYDDLSMVGPDNNQHASRNYMALAVKAYFDNGGQVLYVSRTFATKPGSGSNTVDPGVASSGTPSGTTIVVCGRFPGAFLSGQQVTIALNATPVQKTKNIPPGLLVATAPASAGPPTFYIYNPTAQQYQNAGTPLTDPAPANSYLLTAKVLAPGANGQTMVFDSLGLDPVTRNNYIGDVLNVNPPRHIDALQNQIYVNIGTSLASADKIYGALFGGSWSVPSGASAAVPPTSFTPHTLTGGDDGVEPTSNEYGTALKYLEPLEDVAIVAAPGHTSYSLAAAGGSTSANLTSSEAIAQAIITHVERLRAYRAAILDTPPSQIASDNEQYRAQFDSSYTGLYAPWVVVANPLARVGTAIPAEVTVPPSGFIAGIWARNDVQNSVAKAPANEVLLGAVDLERHISFGEQTILNPLGINCARFFPDRGYRLWGARTASSNSEFKYINVRRYLIYLEHSIDNGTQWAVFENNGPLLWARIKDSVESFLNNEFVQGNLLGSAPAEAYFVRCDRTTITQNMLDNGQLVCLIGVALLKPAEFVIFRIGQKTASARS